MEVAKRRFIGQNVYFTFLMSTYIYILCKILKINYFLESQKRSLIYANVVFNSIKKKSLFIRVIHLNLCRYWVQDYKRLTVVCSKKKLRISGPGENITCDYINVLFFQRFVLSSIKCNNKIYHNN
jgi:hypothetical protein